MELTKDYLQQTFSYDNGTLVWKKSKGAAKEGSVAGYFDKVNNYWKIRLDGKDYLRHRLIFLYHHGYLPENVDHISGDTTDDSIENLRAATYAQNSRNRKSYKGSTSKYVGVSWHSSSKKWVVHIQMNGKRKHIGYYLTEEEAARAYDEWALRLYGEYANMNFFIGD